MFFERKEKKRKENKREKENKRKEKENKRIRTCYSTKNYVTRLILYVRYHTRDKTLTVDS